MQLLINETNYLSGIFFVLPCIETYQKVDLRTITLGVPPQEVWWRRCRYYLFEDDSDNEDDDNDVREGEREPHKFS